MRYLQLIGAGNKFTAIPEAHGCFTGHQVNSTGDSTDNPARDDIRLLKVHVSGLKWDKNRKHNLIQADNNLSLTNFLQPGTGLFK